MDKHINEERCTWQLNAQQRNRVTRTKLFWPFICQTYRSDTRDKLVCRQENMVFNALTRKYYADHAICTNEKTMKSYQ